MTLVSAGAPAITFRVGSAGAKVGELVTIPVTVGGFSNVSSVQFTLAWDPAVLQFISTGGYELAGLSHENFGTAFVSNVKLTFSWDDPGPGGAVLPDGRVLFELTLKVIGRHGLSTPVSVVDDPTVREVTVKLAATDFKTQNGTVLIAPVNEVSAPKLTIIRDENLVVLEWASGSDDFILESASSLSPAINWSPVTVSPSEAAGRRTVTVSISNDNRFYRLRKR